MKISIITVNLNNEDFIEETILSVLNQSLKCEFIIIDGDSHDNSLSIINRYLDKIDIFISEKDSGIYNAMNKGISLANGEWICFMNSGDKFYDNNVLKNIETFLQENIDVVYGDHETRYLTKTKIVKANKNIDNISKGMVFSHQSCFVKKDILQSYKFNELNKITADFELFYKLYNDKKVFKYSSQLIAIVSSGGLSDIKRIESLVSRWNIVEKSLSLNIYYIKLIVLEIIKPYIKKFLGITK